MKRLFAASVLVLAFLLSAPYVRAQDADGPVYIVESGDSLSLIAGTFGVSLSDLLAVNDIGLDHVIQPGDRLLLPGLEGITGIVATKVVEFGETLPVLAMRYGLPVETLIRLNHIANPDRVFAGQRLVVVEPEAGQARLPQWETGKTMQMAAGEPLLLLAAKEGRNPWELVTANRLSSMADQMPGQTILLPDGETPLRAWPLPIIDIRFNSLPLVQGSTSQIWISATDSISAEGLLGDAPLNFRLQNDEWVALQGLDVEAEPGTYPVSIELTLASGEGITFRQDARLVRGEFRTDPVVLMVTPSTLDQNSMLEENQRMAELVSPFTEERFWSGAFTPPSERGISAWFGDRRSYNDGAFTSVHHGVDYYGLLGESILAPAAGKVVFTGEMVICGGATVVDHGWGVYSRFCHQSEFLAGVGEVLIQGQVLGKIGSTGRSTGSHLHWEVWVGGVTVNPLDWIENAFP